MKLFPLTSGTNDRAPASAPAWGRGRRPHRAAFTLLEMLVAITILTLIIFALYGMFNQTQRAFLGSVGQVDVLESGRAATELITREIEQLAASEWVGVTNLYVTNGGLSSVQQLVDGTLRRHRLQEVFFLSRAQGQWIGTAFFVDRASTNSDDTLLRNAGVGTLYRYSSSIRTNRPTDNRLINRFNNAPFTNFQRVADGVVHFQVKDYDRLGNPVGGNNYSYLSNDLPAYLELELAILEPAALERVRGIPNFNAITNYLWDRADRDIQVFRQRIPIRTAFK
jgi:prepilin-type N-terminal cleavage/methylation domain-containing protein